MGAFAMDPNVLDAGKFFRGAKLAPANTTCLVVHEGCMSGTLSYSSLLRLAPMRSALFAFGVELQAPASTPDTVVPLDQRDKVRPCGRGKGLGGEAGHRWMLPKRPGVCATPQGRQPCENYGLKC